MTATQSAAKFQRHPHHCRQANIWATQLRGASIGEQWLGRGGSCQAQPQHVGAFSAPAGLTTDDLVYAASLHKADERQFGDESIRRWRSHHGHIIQSIGAESREPLREPTDPSGPRFGLPAEYPQLQSAPMCSARNHLSHRWCNTICGTDPWSSYELKKSAKKVLQRSYFKALNCRKSVSRPKEL